MLKLVDDVAGAIMDYFKMLIQGLAYFIACVLLVGVPIVVIVTIIGWIL